MLRFETLGRLNVYDTYTLAHISKANIPVRLRFPLICVTYVSVVSCYTMSMLRTQLMTVKSMLMDQRNQSNGILRFLRVAAFPEQVVRTVIKQKRKNRNEAPKCFARHVLKRD